MSLLSDSWLRLQDLSLSLNVSAPFIWTLKFLITSPDRGRKRERFGGDGTRKTRFCFGGLGFSSSLFLFFPLFSSGIISADLYAKEK